jgi:hypothetical protein
LTRWSRCGARHRCGRGRGRGRGHRGRGRRRHGRSRATRDAGQHRSAHGRSCLTGKSVARHGRATDCRIGCAFRSSSRRMSSGSGSVTLVKCRSSIHTRSLNHGCLARIKSTLKASWDCPTAEHVVDVLTPSSRVGSISTSPNTVGRYSSARSRVTCTGKKSIKHTGTLKAHPLVCLLVLSCERVCKDQAALWIAQTSPRVGLSSVMWFPSTITHIQLASLVTSRDINLCEITITSHLHIRHLV